MRCDHGRLQLTGKLFGWHAAGVVIVSFALHLPVRADHNPVRCRITELGQPGRDGIVGSAAAAHKMRQYDPHPFAPGASRRRLVEEHFHLVAAYPAVDLQQRDQALLIVQAAQAQPVDFRDQVVPIHQVIHALIVSLYAMIQAMKSFRRAIPFLLLNVVLSAGITLALLTWWGGGLRFNQAGATLPVPTDASGPSNPDVQPTLLPTLPENTASGDASGRVIEIQDVIGAGDLDNEAVVLRRLGDGDLHLTGWRLDDSSGHSFTFPEFVLSKSGAVQINTRQGTNTAIALFWGLQEAVWTPGKMVSIFDTKNNLQASFTIK